MFQEGVMKNVQIKLLIYLRKKINVCRNLYHGAPDFESGLHFGQSWYVRF